MTSKARSSKPADAQDDAALVVDDTAVVPQAPYDALEKGYHGADAADVGAEVRERDVAGFVRHAELDAEQGAGHAPVQATGTGD